MYLDLFSAPTNKKVQTLNHSTTTTTRKTEEGFYYDALQSLWTFQAMRKRIWGLKTSQHDVMDWFVNQIVTAWFDVPLDGNIAHLSAVGKRDMRVNITL